MVLIHQRVMDQRVMDQTVIHQTVIDLMVDTTEAMIQSAIMTMMT